MEATVKKTNEAVDVTPRFLTLIYGRQAIKYVDNKTGCSYFEDELCFPKDVDINSIKEEITNDVIYVYWFRSALRASCDDYFMKSRTKKYSSAEEFCKDKIPQEYKAWEEKGVKFRCREFKVCAASNKDRYVPIEIDLGDYWKVVPSDMREYDTAYFTDDYCPEMCYFL
jgi:hypothetical protein